MFFCTYSFCSVSVARDGLKRTALFFVGRNLVLFHRRSFHRSSSVHRMEGRKGNPREEERSSKKKRETDRKKEKKNRVREIEKILLEESRRLNIHE